MHIGHTPLIRLEKVVPGQRRRDLGEVGRRQSHRQHEGPHGAVDGARRRAARPAAPGRTRGGLHRRQHRQLAGDGVRGARLPGALRVVRRLRRREAADHARLRRAARRGAERGRQDHARPVPDLPGARARTRRRAQHVLDRSVQQPRQPRRPITPWRTRRSRPSTAASTSS